MQVYVHAKRPVELLSCDQTLSRPVGVKGGGAKETEEEAVVRSRNGVGGSNQNACS